MTETSKKYDELKTETKGDYIVGSVTIHDTKCKNKDGKPTDITYLFKFPGFAQASSFIDLMDEGKKAYWQGLMEGNEDFGVKPMIQNPTVNGKSEKINFKYWDQGHSGFMTVMANCDRFLGEQLK